MKISFHERAWEDYLWWQRQNRQTLRRINLLIEDITRNHYAGIGKPEPLRHNFEGFWSRRIDQEHRLVYAIVGDDVIIAQSRFHYD